jgi:hypothetical protein
MEKHETVPHTRIPFLYRFRETLPEIEYREAFEALELDYDPSLQVNTCEDGLPAWAAGRSATPPTSAYTTGHTIKAGYTSTGKYKPQRYVVGKMDKRAGK